jgi:hypothetical protein
MFLFPIVAMKLVLICCMSFACGLMQKTLIPVLRTAQHSHSVDVIHPRLVFPQLWINDFTRELYSMLGD